MWRPSYFPIVSKYFCWSKPWCSCIYHLLNYNYISGHELIVYTAPYFQCRPISWTSCFQLSFWWMHLRLDMSKMKPLIASSHLTAPEVFSYLSNWNSILSVAEVKTCHGALTLSSLTHDIESSEILLVLCSDIPRIHSLLTISTGPPEPTLPLLLIWLISNNLTGLHMFTFGPYTLLFAKHLKEAF